MPLIKSILIKFIYWFVPPGIQNLIQKIKQEIKADKAALKLCKSNIKFRNIHNDKRCFILCSGPSVNKQNLLPLKDEIVFSVSSGYLYKDYAIIQPRYHCQPGIEHTPRLTNEVYINWFKEMDDRIGRTEIFLNAKDEPFIRQNNLFANRKVSYLYFGLDWDENQREIIDIAKKVPQVQSVPIMCLMIAMYMGFREIYLLGCDHDWLSHYGKSTHFYDERQDIITSEGGSDVWTDLEDGFRCCWVLWRQYRILREVAQTKGITIYNATAGGLLDVFSRVNYESLFNNSP